MGIPKKKRQLIKRNYPKCSVDEIAVKTGLSVQDIENVLGIHQRDKGTDLSKILSLVLEWGIVSSVFLAPFIMFPWLRDASNLPQTAFVQVSTLFLASVWAFKGIIDKKLEFISSPFIWPLICFLVWCLISFFVAANPFEGVPVFLQVLAMCVCFILVLNTYYKKENFDRLVMALLFAGAGIAIIGILQYLFEFSMIPQARPPAATFSNRNMASQFMVIVIPFGIYLFWTAEKGYSRWGAAVLTGLTTLYAVYAESLASWISIFFGFIFFFLVLFFQGFIKKEITFRDKLIPLITTLVCFLLLINIDSSGLNLKFGGVSEQVSSVRKFVADAEQKDDEQRNVENKTKVSTIQWRWSVWLNSAAMVKDNPVFGVGAGNYKIKYPLYNQKVVKDVKFKIENQLARAHNDYIQAAAEYGITGLVIIFWAIGIFLYSLIILIKSESSAKSKLLYTAILSAGFGILLNAAFSFPFQRAIPLFYMMFLSGLTGVLFVKLRKTVPKRITNHSLLNSIAIILSLLLVYSIYFNYNMIRFDQYYGRTINYYNQGRWEQCLQEADKALNYNSQRKEILFYKGYASNELGKIEESIKYYEELLNYFPNYINGLLNLGLAYEKLGKHEKALAMFSKLIRIMPDHAGYYSDAGHNLMQLGKVDLAYDYLKKAVDLNAFSEVIQFNFGVACVQKKRYNEAKQAFQKAVELKPGWEKPLQYLRFIEEQNSRKE
jgi:tetratricopeptide (TPR) repeat protein